MARVWGFPGFSILAATQQQAEQTLLHQLRSWLAHAPPTALAGRLFADLPASELRRVAVPLSPPTRQSHWRTAVTLQLDYVVVRTAAHLFTAWVPELNLTILTNQLEQVESQLQRQVLAFLRRQRRLNLGDLTQFHSGNHQTRLVTLEIEVKTPSQRGKRAEQTAARAQKTLARYARRMLPSELPPAYCFAPMIKRVAALMRPPNSESVLLVGPAGVGKTALFQQLVRQQVELGFLTQQFWSTDGSTIVAGACGFGMWQQRCERLVAGCQQTSAWLHLGNLFELDEAGRIGGAVGVGGYLAGPIVAGKLQAVAECTDQQFALLERKSPELIAAFHVVQIEPADAALTTDILLEWATAEASGRGLYHTVGVAKKRKKNRSTARARTRTLSAKKGSLVKQVSHELQSVRVEPEAIALLERLQRRFPTDVAAPGRPLRMLQQWARPTRGSLDRCGAVSALLGAIAR